MIKPKYVDCVEVEKYAQSPSPWHRYVIIWARHDAVLPQCRTTFRKNEMKNLPLLFLSSPTLVNRPPRRVAAGRGGGRHIGKNAILGRFECNLNNALLLFFPFYLLISDSLSINRTLFLIWLSGPCCQAITMLVLIEYRNMI